ncbi:protein SODIUM POTASSIUM ROOT DEFECTIVE 2-like [Primulina eburnea]|uniref:protein SODIUM POTASSIUM ROOT DEFECTIVE 2-like n=1 Tax=Primulina eburnea TaxID=1245227 RepID=UPI003C6BD923
MDEGSSSSFSSHIQPGSSPAIDRYNPIIRDSRRNARSIPPFSTSQQTITPKTPKNQLKKKNKKIPSIENGDQAKIKMTCADSTIISDGNSSGGVIRESRSHIKTADFITPPSSTRYLLSNDRVRFNSLSDFDPNLNLFTGETSKSEAVKTDEPYDVNPPTLSCPADQVVVLKVSLHCRGCERKMRKHISRMEGVTSFDIDFAAKKVTVAGKVTPLSVLSSISKVKNAQLWPPTISSSIQTPLSFSNSAVKKGYKEAAAA